MFNQFFSVLLFMVMGLRNTSVEICGKEYLNGMSFPQDIHNHFVDPNQIGNVYILIFKHPYLNRKFAHHAILVDVAGGSNDSHLHGVTIHLTATASTKITKSRVDDQPFHRKRFDEIIYIGRIQPSQSSPRFWAFDLQREGYQLFYQLTNGETNVTWSSEINCQAYVNYWLRQHGFQWPDELPYLTEDHTPIIIDVSIDLIHLSATSSVKFTTDPDEQ